MVKVGVVGFVELSFRFLVVLDLENEEDNNCFWKEVEDVEKTK